MRHFTRPPSCLKGGGGRGAWSWMMSETGGAFRAPPPLPPSASFGGAGLLHCFHSLDPYSPPFVATPCLKLCSSPWLKISSSVPTMAGGRNINEISDALDALHAPESPGARGSTDLEAPVLRGWTGYVTPEDGRPWWYKEGPPERIHWGEWPPLDEDSAPPSPRDPPQSPGAPSSSHILADPFGGMDTEMLTWSPRVVSVAPASSPAVAPPPPPYGG